MREGGGVIEGFYGTCRPTTPSSQLDTYVHVHVYVSGSAFY